MLDLELRVQEAENGGLPCFDSDAAVEILSATFRQEESLGSASATPIVDGALAHVRNQRATPIQTDLSASMGFSRGPVARHAAHQAGAHAPPWLVAMAPSFYKDIDHIDRKLQGRILEAIADIAKRILQPQGDTIKPLVGDYKHCWRYRIGDYRLIFMPDVPHASITLLAFASRGSIYED